MTQVDWRWQVSEAIERVRTRYDFIGRKTGAPFLAIVYPPELEATVLQEWHTQSHTIEHDDLDIHSIDVLSITHKVLSDIGPQNAVDALQNPMPGSNPEAELGQLWISRVADDVESSLVSIKGKRPVVVLERIAALYPAAGPRDLMQMLWDSAPFALSGPVVIFIPGYHRGFRTYSYLGVRDEFMYRGDIL